MSFRHLYYTLYMTIVSVSPVTANLSYSYTCIQCCSIIPSFPILTVALNSPFYVFVHLESTSWTMNSEDNWSPELLVYLRTATRELQFDWKAVTQAVREFAESELPGHSLVIDPASCRQRFALDYKVSATETTDFAPSSDGKGIESPVDGEDEKNAEPSVAMSSLLQGYENLSLEELIAPVDAAEEQMKVRTEQVFQRVLNSLGGEKGRVDSILSVDHSNSTVSNIAFSDYEYTKQAYSDNLAAKAAERLKKEAYLEEQAERQRFEAQREALRRRFEAGSADCEGDDPLLQSASANQVQQQMQQLYATGLPMLSEGKLGGGVSLTAGSNGNIIVTSGASGASAHAQQAPPAEKHSTPELDFIDSLPYDAAVTQALEQYMETDEFEVMLSELEKEIDAMAPPKDGDADGTE